VAPVEFLALCNRPGALSILPKFPVGISEISMYQMERYLPLG